MLKLGYTNVRVDNLHDLMQFVGWVHVVYSFAISEEEHKLSQRAQVTAKQLRHELNDFNKLVAEVLEEIGSVDSDTILTGHAVKVVNQLVSLYT